MEVQKALWPWSGKLRLRNGHGKQNFFFIFCYKTQQTKDRKWGKGVRGNRSTNSKKINKIQLHTLTHVDDFVSLLPLVAAVRKQMAPLAILRKKLMLLYCAIIMHHYFTCALKRVHKSSGLQGNRGSVSRKGLRETGRHSDKVVANGKLF